MKSKILTIALGTVMTACSATAANDSYTVTADVPAEFNGKTAFIVNFDTGEKIDSVAVANGTATFKGEIAKPVTARLIVDAPALSFSKAATSRLPTETPQARSSTISTPRS